MHGDLWHFACSTSCINAVCSRMWDRDMCHRLIIAGLDDFVFICCRHVYTVPLVVRSSFTMQEVLWKTQRDIINHSIRFLEETFHHCYTNSVKQFGHASKCCKIVFSETGFNFSKINVWKLFGQQYPAGMEFSFTGQFDHVSALLYGVICKAWRRSCNLIWVCQCKLAPLHYYH